MWNGFIWLRMGISDELMNMARIAENFLSIRATTSFSKRAVVCRDPTVMSGPDCYRSSTGPKKFHRYGHIANSVEPASLHNLRPGSSVQALRACNT
jgi:hypothetical protein